MSEDSLKRRWDANEDKIQVRFPDMAAYIKASQMRDEAFEEGQSGNLVANRFFKKKYDELATVERDKKLVSKLDVKDKQKWVQLKPYLLSHGQRRMRCSKGLSCRPTKKVPGYGPKTIAELLQEGFGPHQKNPPIGDEILKRLKLLLRMAYVKDAYRGRARMYWEVARYKLRGSPEWIHFDKKFGAMNQQQFVEAVDQIDNRMGRDYKDPTQEDADIFAKFIDGDVDAEEMPMEGPERPEAIDSDDLLPMDDPEDDPEDEPEDDAEDNAEDDAEDDETDAPQTPEEPAKSKEPEEPKEPPLEYTAGGETTSGVKPQVLRRDGGIVTRSPTKAEFELANSMDGVGMVGRLFENGKFGNKMGKRARMRDDPDYVHFRGKWVLSPAKYPKNNAKFAPWNFLDRTLLGEHQTVKLHEMSPEERVKFRTALDSQFPDGIHVSQWQDAVSILKGKGYAAEDLRLHTPWGGVLTAQDTELDVEVRGNGDENLTQEELKKKQASNEEKQKRERYRAAIVADRKKKQTQPNALTMLLLDEF
jgi:hypothetical protein